MPHCLLRSTAPRVKQGVGLRGQVAKPNGFGMIAGFDSQGRPVHDGVNGNELTDTADRDPFPGIPHHCDVRCRVQKFEETALR